VNGSTHQDDALRDVRMAMSDGMEQVRDMARQGQGIAQELSRRGIDRDVTSRKGLKT